MSTETFPEADSSTAIARGVKIVGEACVAPGSSLILDGDLVRGGAHLVGGLLAKAVLGPIGLFAVAANSYSRSVNQRNLTDGLFDKKD